MEDHPARVLAAHTEQWQRVLWGVAAVALIAAFSSLLWFSLDLLNRMNDMVGKANSGNLTFLFSAIGLTHSTLLRLMGIFTGTAVAFAGLMISFFTHAKETRLSLASGGDEGERAGLATYSPGIVAIVVGAAIVVASLYDKSSFDYNGVNGDARSGAPIAGGPPNKLPAPDDFAKLMQQDTPPAPANTAPAAVTTTPDPITAGAGTEQSHFMESQRRQLPALDAGACKGTPDKPCPPVKHK